MIRRPPSSTLSSSSAASDVYKRQCDIKGASDASIRNAVPNDVAALIQKLGVRAVFCNGAASGRIYAKYAEPLTYLPAAVLPSTSPANAAWSPARLQAAWGAALAPFLRADGCK